MKSRRSFIKLSALGSAAFIASSCVSSDKKEVTKKSKTKVQKPIVISTWRHGMQANAEAWKILSQKGKAIDAVEKGVMVVESDPNNQSVGLGGLPDRDGFVTLDACIMDENNRCGAVACLQDIENPIAVARKVMDETPHVLLVGEGALQFAVEKGFKKVNLLTNKAKKAWEAWKIRSKYQPVINSENHDTIGMLALDADGNLSGSCTTSGMAYKLHGRVGDSPLIGAGLFVDNEVGAACATGVGEAVIRIAGSAIVIELMRQGVSPNDACKTAVERIVSKHKDVKGLQVGFIALNKYGEHGGYSVYNGFDYALRTKEQNQMIKANFNRKQ
jgi:N4-(beta-N-acetylglucosaminyl)-L-asparaginase